jgi:hypothetical protein
MVTSVIVGNALLLISYLGYLLPARWKTVSNMSFHQALQSVALEYRNGQQPA